MAKTEKGHGNGVNVELLFCLQEVKVVDMSYGIHSPHMMVVY